MAVIIPSFRIEHRVSPWITGLSAALSAYQQAKKASQTEEDRVKYEQSQQDMNILGQAIGQAGSSIANAYMGKSVFGDDPQMKKLYAAHQLGMGPAYAGMVGREASADRRLADRKAMWDYQRENPRPPTRRAESFLTPKQFTGLYRETDEELFWEDRRNSKPPYDPETDTRRIEMFERPSRERVLERMNQKLGPYLEERGGPFAVPPDATEPSSSSIDDIANRMNPARGQAVQSKLQYTDAQNKQIANYRDMAAKVQADEAQSPPQKQELIQSLARQMSQVVPFTPPPPPPTPIQRDIEAGQVHFDDARQVVVTRDPKGGYEVRKYDATDSGTELASTERRRMDLEGHTVVRDDLGVIFLRNKAGEWRMEVLPGADAKEKFADQFGKFYTAYMQASDGRAPSGAETEEYFARLVTTQRKVEAIQEEVEQAKSAPRRFRRVQDGATGTGTPEQLTQAGLVEGKDYLWID